MKPNYKTAPKGNPKDNPHGTPPKYINYRAVAKKNVTTAFQETERQLKGNKYRCFIAKEIADETSLSVFEVLAVIEKFLKLVPKTLADGYTIDLGDFGTMEMEVKSKSEKSPYCFKQQCRRGVKPCFSSRKIV